MSTKKDELRWQMRPALEAVARIKDDIRIIDAQIERLTKNKAKKKTELRRTQRELNAFRKKHKL